MPIYEYICHDCRKKTNSFLRSIASSTSPTCSSCGSHNLSKLVSGFAFHKSEATILEEAGPPPEVPNLDYYKDPRVIGRWTEKRMKEMGQETPSQVREMIEQARSGEMPEQIKGL